MSELSKRLEFFVEHFGAFSPEGQIACGVQDGIAELESENYKLKDEWFCPEHVAMLNKTIERLRKQVDCRYEHNHTVGACNKCGWISMAALEGGRSE